MVRQLGWFLTAMGLLLLLNGPAGLAASLPAKTAKPAAARPGLALAPKTSVLPAVSPQKTPVKGPAPLKPIPAMPLDPLPLKPLAPLGNTGSTKNDEPSLSEKGRHMLNGMSRLIDRTKASVQQKGPLVGTGRILILPILHHGKEKAFYNVALPVANALADQLAARLSNPQLLAFPGSIMSEIDAAGLRPLYEQLAEQVDSTGHPDARLQQDLIEQLLASPSSASGANASGEERLIGFSHVVWVTADADLNHPAQASSLWQKFHNLTGDNLPMEANLFVTASMRIFKTGNGPVMTSQKQATASVPNRRFVNITPSVYQDRDSTQAFNAVSQVLAERLLKGLGNSALGGMPE